MGTDPFLIFESPRPVDDLGCWAEVTGRFAQVAGHTAFGDFFLVDPDTQQYAVLYTINPELVPINIFGREAFRSSFLNDARAIEEIGKPNKVAALIALVGPLGQDEVYYPVPYPFVGGSGELETFQKGDVWVFADLVGQMQGVGGA